MEWSTLNVLQGRDMKTIPSQVCLFSSRWNPGCCKKFSPFEVASPLGNPFHCTTYFLMVSSSAFFLCSTKLFLALRPNNLHQQEVGVLIIQLYVGLLLSSGKIHEIHCGYFSLVETPIHRPLHQSSSKFCKVHKTGAGVFDLPSFSKMKFSTLLALSQVVS